MAATFKGAPTAQHESRRPGSVRQALLRRPPQGPLEQRGGLEIRFAQTDANLVSRGAHQPLDEVRRGRPGARLDPGDRGLRHPGALRQGNLSEPCTLSGLAYETSENHPTFIANPA